jgi:hypothetical protein
MFDPSPHWRTAGKYQKSPNIKYLESYWSMVFSTDSKGEAYLNALPLLRTINLLLASKSSTNHQPLFRHQT